MNFIVYDKECRCWFFEGSTLGTSRHEMQAMLVSPCGTCRLYNHKDLAACIVMRTLPAVLSRDPWKMYLHAKFAVYITTWTSPFLSLKNLAIYRHTNLSRILTYFKVRSREWKHYSMTGTPCRRPLFAQHAEKTISGPPLSSHCVLNRESKVEWWD